MTFEPRPEWRDKADRVLRGFTVDGITCIWSPANEAYALTRGDAYGSGQLLGIVPKGERKGRIEDLFRPEGS